MAKETIEICERGGYASANGEVVNIREQIGKAVAGTKVFAIESMSGITSAGVPSATKYEVTDETTIAAIRRLHGASGGHLACLNFASAKNPGGGFLGGAEAQEESLARSSALYTCLLAAPEYYERNRGCRTALYLDQAIWSPAVTFFRDDTGELLDVPCCASVITAPAPNAGAISDNEPTRLDEVEPTLRRRASFVLDIAAACGVRRLVLGAWGCGVFRNDPVMVAQVFHDLLHAKPRFDEVVFAIFDRSKERSVLRAFETAFA